MVLKVEGPGRGSWIHPNIVEKCVFFAKALGQPHLIDASLNAYNNQ